MSAFSRATFATALLLTLSGCAAEEEQAKKATTAPSAATSSSETSGDTTTEENAPEANPDGTYSSNCDYLLESNFDNFTSSHAGWFVADARLKNSGNIGIVARVTASWRQAGSRDIKETKKVKVPYEGRKTIHFKRNATQTEIDAHQSLGFSSKTCRVKVAILDTFGEAQ